MSIKAKLESVRNISLGLGVALIVVMLFIWLSPWKTSSLTPPDIKKQLNFSAVYPRSSADIQISPANFSYQAGQGALAISLSYQGKNITLTEQKAPDSVVANPLAANQQLGVHPYTQFQSRFGTVSLTKLYQSNTYRFQGQLGVLVTKGTLVLAHSSQDLSLNQGMNFFNSLSLD